MVSDSQASTLRSIQAGISTLVRRDLAEFFRSLNLSSPERARDALLGYIPGLVETYGAGAASVAADWYDEVRSQLGVRSRFRAEVQAPVGPERVERMLRFAARHLFTDAPDLMLPAIDGATSRYVLEPARMTVAVSAEKDPASQGWERRARAEACDFCQMLAGRGAAYAHRGSAHFDAHDDCNCVAVPAWGL